MDIQVHTTTWYGNFPCRASLQQNDPREYANYSPNCDSSLNNIMASEDACEAAVQVSQVEDQEKTPNSDQKRHGGIKFIFCLVLCSNVLSMAALAVAIACILLWTSEVRDYKDLLLQLRNITEHISMCTTMRPWIPMLMILDQKQIHNILLFNIFHV